MSIRNLKGQVEDKIPVKNVLISVFDKSYLEDFILGLVQTNPDIRFISTGGTYQKIKEILKDSAGDHLLEVAEYTGFPEMEGGLVKTLHPKIHAGILAERNNPLHQKYLAKNLNKAVFIDMVVVNLYPFEKVTASAETTFEQARGNIDIGGPTLLRAAAKNFPSCAAVCDPQDYQEVLETIKANGGSTTFNQRFTFAKKVFQLTEKYDGLISKYLIQQSNTNLGEIRSHYNFKHHAK